MSHLVPRPSKCPECRGSVTMSICKACAGTGVVFRVNGAGIFPDTSEGYAQADRALNDRSSTILSSDNAMGWEP